VQDLRLDSPLTLDGSAALGVLDASLHGAEGEQNVIVRLKGKSLAAAGIAGDSAQAAYVGGLNSAQNRFMERIASTGATELGRVQRVLNAVFIQVDADSLKTIAADRDVLRVALVGNYEMDLSETVPYIGAAAVQPAGVDGSGIKVAVLDSGIDYNHAALGGSGDPADYAANDSTIIEPGSFPTDKVVGGYDFVGSDWPNSDEAPDPDPLDDGSEAGHGTHVAHIIGGNVTDEASGIYPGVAPGVDLYAVKVCSSVSTACSGIALIQGMDFAVDPNMDGKVKDRVDVVNMSLGSNYGQPFDDDLSAAVDGATALGVLTVASAGNSADKPYITGTPGAAPTALSVAQTQVPSASLQLITVDGADYPAVFQPWSVPLSGVITGSVQYADGAGGNRDGCAPFAPGSLTGLIVLVDRGACNFTLKISNISQAGGEAGIIGLVAPGAPFSGGDGGDRPIDIPGYMISQADSNAIKASLPSTGTIDPANQLPLVGQVVGSSSRGPSNYYQAIKPEIGAPGASVSAIAGTGTENGPFGGTSGAAPMVTGSAALVLDAFGGTKTNATGTPPGTAIGYGLDPLTVKALLMNNGETDIDTDPFTGLAPITRIGGGEVRVDRAVSAPVAAFSADDYTGALGFGFVDVADTVTLTKTVTIRNLDTNRHTYSVLPTFRYDSDEATGAVAVSAPSSVTVKPGLGRETTFEVSITIDGSLLPGNYMNSGSNGANGDALTFNEFDGYLILDDGSHPIHLAWHVLPRKAADVVPYTMEITPGAFPQEIGLDNQGAGTAQNDAYALLAISPDQAEGERGEQSPTPDIRAVGINTFPVPAGYCSGNSSFVWAFAVNTWERQSHVLPVSFIIDLDTNQDGEVDATVLNRDASAAAPGFNQIGDGRQLAWVLNYNTNSASAYFYAEHATNTGNTVLYICGEQIGLTGTDLLSTHVDMSVFAQDFYYGGPGDLVDGLTVTPLGERFYGAPNDVAGFTDDPAGLSVYDFGLFPGNTPELGLMLLTNGDRGSGARGGATADTEALLFTVP
jgi:subtilisin family serine protease